jgi:hypothetical protein
MSTPRTCVRRYTDTNLFSLSFPPEFTDEEYRSDEDEEAEPKDNDAAHVVWRKDEAVRGESDDDSEDSDLEPEVELEPWFVPEDYKVCACVRVGVGGCARVGPFYACKCEHAMCACAAHAHVCTFVRIRACVRMSVCTRICTCQLHVTLWVWRLTLLCTFYGCICGRW